MEITAGSILRNSTAIFLGTLAQKLIGLYTLRALAIRMDQIAPHMFGDWNTVFVFLGFFGFLVDFNLDTVLVRELNRGGQDPRRALGSLLYLRLALCLVAWAALSLLVWWTPYPLALQQMILLAALSFPLSVVGLFRSVCQARLQSRIAQAYSVAGALVTLGLMLWLLSRRAGLVWFVVAQAFGALPVHLLLIWRAARLVRPSLVLDRALCRELFGAALPLGVSAALGVVMYRFDALYLSWVRGTQEVGLYAACYRLTEAFSFVPGAVVGSVYPAMARFAEGEPERLRHAFAVTARWLLILALPLLLATTLSGDRIIAGMYGPPYAASAPALRWLGLAELCNFFSPLLWHLLFALNRNRLFLRSALLSAGFNVAANLLLVERYGFVASAAITAGTESLMVLTALWWLRGTGHLRLPEQGGRILLSAAGTGLLLLILPSMPLWGGLGLLTVGYPITLLAVGGLTREDVRFIRQAMQSYGQNKQGGGRG